MSAETLPGFDGDGWPQVAEPGAVAVAASPPPPVPAGGELAPVADSGPAATVASPPASGPVLLAVDGNSLAHRMYHAYERTNMRDPAGRPIWAINGFLRLLVGIIDRTDPAAIVVGFDDRTSSARRDRYPQYKAGRPERTDDLYAQLDQLPEILAELGVTVVVPAGLEADDVLASAAVASEAAGWRCTIATSDKDAFALITDAVTVLRLLNGGLDNAVLMTPAALFEQYKVTPAAWRDYTALVGDKSDNLPGPAGIGPTTAVRLLAGCGTLDAALADPAAAVAASGKTMAARLTSPASRALIARNRDLMAPMIVPVDPGRCRLSATGATIAKVLRAHHLPSLIEKTAAALGTTTAVAAVPKEPERPRPAPPELLLCRTPECGARIRMVRTTTGGRMPIDAAPDPAGTLGWVQTREGWRMAVLEDGQVPADGRRWVSHFATCAKPDDHRQPRRRHLRAVRPDETDVAAAPGLHTAPVPARAPVAALQVRGETRPCCTPGHDDGRATRLYPGGVFCDPCIAGQRAARAAGRS